MDQQKSSGKSKPRKGVESTSGGSKLKKKALSKTPDDKSSFHAGKESITSSKGKTTLAPGSKKTAPKISKTSLNFGSATSTSGNKSRKSTTTLTSISSTVGRSASSVSRRGSLKTDGVSRKSTGSASRMASAKVAPTEDVPGPSSSPGVKQRRSVSPTDSAGPTKYMLPNTEVTLGKQSVYEENMKLLLSSAKLSQTGAMEEIDPLLLERVRDTVNRRKSEIEKFRSESCNRDVLPETGGLGKPISRDTDYTKERDELNIFGINYVDNYFNEERLSQESEIFKKAAEDAKKSQKRPKLKKVTGEAPPEVVEEKPPVKAPPPPPPVPFVPKPPPPITTLRIPAPHAEEKVLGLTAPPPPKISSQPEQGESTKDTTMVTLGF